MADRGRDLKIALLSDTSRFDLAAPASDLEDLAKGADKSSDELKRLATQGKDAQGELDKLAKAAKDTGTKVDSAFDKIAKSSKSNLRKVDDDAHKAETGLKDMKEEAGQTARESAASFSDMTSALDAVQEVAANAFSGFGPAGMAAGILAASGIGIAFSMLQTAADKANAAKDRIIELGAAIRDAGGEVGTVDFTSRLSDWGDAIADNRDAWEVWQKDNTSNFELVKAAADDAGVSFNDLWAGLSGGDPKATAHAWDILNTALAANADATTAADAAAFATLATGERNAFTTTENVTATRGHTSSLEFLRQAMTDNLRVVDEATARGRTQAEAARIATQAEKDLASAIDGFTDPVNAYTSLLATKTTKEQESAQATADATKDQKDSWQDYAKAVSVSVDDYLGELERQVVAQEQWATNMATLSNRGVEDGVLAELAKMGPEGAPLVAKLTKASAGELDKLVSLFGRQGAAASGKAASGITSGVPKVRTAASKAHDAAEVGLSGRINIPVGVASPTTRDLQRARNIAENWFALHPATVKLKPGPWASGYVIP